MLLCGPQLGCALRVFLLHSRLFWLACLPLFRCSGKETTRAVVGRIISITLAVPRRAFCSLGSSHTDTQSLAAVLRRSGLTHHHACRPGWPGRSVGLCPGGGTPSVLFVGWLRALPGGQGGTQHSTTRHPTQNSDTTATAFSTTRSASNCSALASLLPGSFPPGVFASAPLGAGLAGGDAHPNTPAAPARQPQPSSLAQSSIQVSVQQVRLCFGSSVGFPEGACRCFLLGPRAPLLRPSVGCHTSGNHIDSCWFSPWLLALCASRAACSSHIHILTSLSACLSLADPVGGPLRTPCFQRTPPRERIPRVFLVSRATREPGLLCPVCG